MIQRPRVTSSGLNEKDHALLVKELTKYAEEGASDDDLIAFKKEFVAQKKKSIQKKVSEPIAAEEPLVSNTQTTKPATSLATEEPEQAQASDGLGGPPAKMKEFTGFTQEEQQRMQSPQKPATTLPTKKQVQATAGKPVKQMITQYADIAKQKQDIEAKKKQDLLNGYINRHKKEYEESYNNFLNAHQDSDIDRQEANQETDDEFKKQGVLNTLKDFGKNAWNTIVDVNATGLSFGTTDKGPEFLKFETDPTKEYTDKANKEYEQVVLLTEKARKLDPSIELPKYDPEQIKKRAYEIAVQSKLDNKRESRVNNMLRNQSPDVQDMLKEHARKDYTTLSQEDKRLLDISNLSKSLYQKNTEKLVELSKNIADLESKGMQVPPELTSQLESEKNINDKLRINALKDQSKYSDKNTKLGSFEENLDVLNRDHSFSNNAYTTIKLIGNEMKRGGYGVLGYFSQLFPENKEFEGTNKWIENKVRKESDKIESMRSSVEKPTDVSGIHSASDFGRWMSNSVIIPTAGFMAKLSNPEIGIPLLMGESLGNSYQDMKDQMEANPNIQYSKTQLLAAPALKSAIDGAMFLFNASLLKGAQRVIKSAGNVEKDLIADSVLKELTKKQLHGVAVMDGVTIAKNAVDKYSGIDPNKNLLDGTKDATAVSFVTVGMLDTAPRIAVHVASEFSLDNSALKASAKVNDLTLRLDQKGLSDEHREIISKQLEKAKDDMHKIVKSQVKDISSLSDSQYKETIRLNNTRANIFEKAKSIKMDQSISPEIKKQLFEGLKEELDATNSRRRELLLNGPKAELERMDPVVADALRAKAETQLIKENNPNGDKDVTIPQADIDKRAMVLHNEKAFETEQAKTAPVVNEEFEAKKLEIEKNREKAHKDLEENPQSFGVNGNYSLPEQIDLIVDGVNKNNELRSTKDIDAEYDKQQEALKKEYEAPAVVKEKPSGEKVVPLHETIEGLKDLGKRDKLRAIDENIDKIIKELGLETKNCD